MNIEVGKEYVCKHQRKGTFHMRVTHVSDEWVDGTVIGGTTAKAMLYENTRFSGENVTVRRSHCTFDVLPRG